MTPITRIALDQWNTDPDLHPKIAGAMWAIGQEVTAYLRRHGHLGPEATVEVTDISPHTIKLIISEQEGPT